MTSLQLRPRLRAVLYLVAVTAAGAALAQSAKQDFEPRVGQAGKDVVWVPTAQTLVDKMLDMAKAAPGDYVIDLGSGDGRTVITAARRGIKAHGIEYNPDMVALSKRNAEVAGVADKATFVHADIFNSHYNPKGAIAPESYRFPCADGSVDLVFAASLFTHLQPKAADRYLEESARVLKPGGRAALSFFLLDDPVRARLDDFTPRFATFPEPWYAVADPREPEAAIAFALDSVVEALARHGFETQSVTRGSWSFHQGGLSFQDFLFCRKRRSGAASAD